METNDDGGGGENWTTGAIGCAKLQSDHHHQQTNIHCLLWTLYCILSTVYWWIKMNIFQVQPT